MTGRSSGQATYTSPKGWCKGAKRLTNRVCAGARDPMVGARKESKAHAGSGIMPEHHAGHPHVCLGVQEPKGLEQLEGSHEPEGIEQLEGLEQPEGPELKN